jgi:hypothetical protein
LVNAAAERKDCDMSKRGGHRCLLDLTQRNRRSRRVRIGSDEIRVAVVVIVSGIDGICQCEATYARLLIVLKSSITIALINERAGTASCNDVRNSISIHVSKVRVRRNIRDIGRGREISLSISKKNEEAVANIAVPAAWTGN